ncbi:hypothetical protein NGM10_01185 [Halorussus salilacus]|uniref:hypothetical protein n=1 Tax=Halorussus salilacus TaxID=2953750 RepID=UPI00209D031C|nr:hypothetical protein [Halorussus salilacus]USZ68368.1 hypothetical protein NGM10_01185 [Halorussus salilacus]
MDLVTFAFIAQTATLVIASALLVYPVVAYAHNVAHTRGLLFLSGALLAITVSYVAGIVLELSVASAAFDLASALLAAAGIWQFARPFVRFEDPELDTETVERASGGFESAGDD